MAHFPMRAMLLLGALALVAGGAWVTHGKGRAGKSITVKLPPPRAATPRPGFTFEDAQRQP